MFVRIRNKKLCRKKKPDFYSIRVLNVHRRMFSEKKRKRKISNRREFTPFQFFRYSSLWAAIDDFIVAAFTDAPETINARTAAEMRVHK